jgi:hypothetical protein
MNRNSRNLVFRPSECPSEFQQTRSWQPSLPSEPRTSATVCYRIRVPFSTLLCEASRSHVCSSTFRVHFQEIGAPKTGVRSIHGSIRGMRASEAETRAVSPKPKVAASAARIPTAPELQRRRRVTQVSATQEKALVSTQRRLPCIPSRPKPQSRRLCGQTITLASHLSSCKTGRFARFLHTPDDACLT